MVSCAATTTTTTSASLLRALHAFPRHGPLPAPPGMRDNHRQFSAVSAVRRGKCPDVGVDVDVVLVRMLWMVDW